MNKQNNDEFTDLLKKTFVFDWMEQHNVMTLTAHFNGEGDSGSFERFVSVALKPEAQSDAYYRHVNEKLDNTQTVFRHNSNRALTLSKLVVAMSEEIETNTSHGVDWWNNEGGQGTVEWVLNGEDSNGDTIHRGIVLTVEERVIEYRSETFTVENNYVEPSAA